MWNPRFTMRSSRWTKAAGRSHIPGAPKTNVLSVKLLAKLRIPPNVVIKNAKKAWWLQALDEEWISETSVGKDGPDCLIRDQASVHKSQKSTKLLKEMNVRQLFTPVAKTWLYQPWDVEDIGPFKVFYRQEYVKWREANFAVSKKGYLKPPSRQDLTNFVTSSWFKITVACVRNAFRKSLAVGVPSLSVDNEKLEKNGPEVELPVENWISLMTIFKSSMWTSKSLFAGADHNYLPKSMEIWPQYISRCRFRSLVIVFHTFLSVRLVF